ncbi:MAG TPA: hypothetical protein VLQ45_17390 [Thermoanaerobaculia bacterium]|nr:hypothetical protein [Thermoanaerobaculia bacterium]
MVDALEAAPGRTGARGVGWPAWLQALAAAALAALLYAGLYAELPIDDTLHFGPHIEAGIFEWDAAHLFMQPAVVLWHRVLGFGGPARASQERFNTFCAALSLGIFYLLLLRLGVAPVGRAVLTALAAVSYNLLNLASSGHVKLAVLPFLTAALYHAVLWERDERADGTGGVRRLAAAAVFLGVASGFLINSVLVAPFLALAVAAVSLFAGAGVRRALGRAFAVGGLCGATGLAVLAAGYALAGAGPWSVRGFFGFLLAKTALRPPVSGELESLARGAFGVVQNFVWVGSFGPMLRALMEGDSSFLPAHRGRLVAEGAVFLAAAALLAWVYLGALRRLGRGRSVAAVPLAFILGALAFAIPWNLNESDFYFPLTLPTVVLIAAAPKSAMRSAVSLLLLGLAAWTSIGEWAVPKKLYPLRRYNAELQTRLTSRDLVVHWYVYTGGPSVIFLDLPGVPRLPLDRAYERSPGRDLFFSGVAGAIDRRLAEGGRVYLFGILDDRSWNAPWPGLRRQGLTLERLDSFFRERYTVADRGEIAGIPCWELLPKSGRGGG